MSLGTPYIKPTIPSVSGGVTSSLSGGDVQNTYGTSAVMASTNLSVVNGSQIVAAEKDAPIVTDTTLKAKLLGIAAPVTSLEMIFGDYSSSGQVAMLFGSTI